MPLDLGLNGVHAKSGAAGGIGLEITRAFAEQGANVTAHYNTTNTTLPPLISEFGQQRIQAVQANLIEETAVDNLFRQATSTFGEVQVLVLNHAIAPPADEPVWKMSLERWKHTIDTNLTSFFIVSKEYLTRLETSSETVKDNASMLLIGSTAGKYGEAGHADYAASKSGLMYGLALSLKNEIVKIAPKARVNTIGPGWVLTPRTASKRDNMYSSLATTPLKKIAIPRDIANQAVVLSSQKVSGHITGQVLMIEGGMEGRLLNKPEDI